MYEDPIVEELRAIRREHVKKLHSDPRAILKDLKRQEAESGRTFVQRAIRRVLTNKDVVKTA